MNERIIVHCVRRWSLIAGRLPGRTDNEIKNYWNTHIRRKLLSRGIDPATHRPLNDPASAPASHNNREPAATTTISISFAAPNPKQEEDSSKGSVSEENIDSKRNVLERCPDLNLELSISPPHHPNQPLMPLKSMGRSRSRSPCFACSLGLQYSKDCSCGINGNTSSESSTAAGYDFLGLKTSVLDYRSLETKRNETGPCSRNSQCWRGVRD